MAGFEACLLDAFGTIVSTDFSGHRAELPVLAGIPADAMYAEFGRLAPALTVGDLSMAEVFEQILRACGVQPAPRLVRALTDKSRELVLATGRLYDDVLPFLRTLRSLGVRTAIVPRALPTQPTHLTSPTPPHALPGSCRKQHRSSIAAAPVPAVR